MANQPVLSVLFVCLGNICRSPTAQGVFERKVVERGLADRIQVDSAGTAAFHVGARPDPRSVAAAKLRGYDLSRLKARHALAEDFFRFDYVLGLDQSNLDNLRALEPPESRAKLGLLLDFAPHTGMREVPDPYYGGPKGFDRVLDLVEVAADGLLNEIERELLG